MFPQQLWHRDGSHYVNGTFVTLAAFTALAARSLSVSLPQDWGMSSSSLSVSPRLNDLECRASSELLLWVGQGDVRSSERFRTGKTSTTCISKRTMRNRVSFSIQSRSRRSRSAMSVGGPPARCRRAFVRVSCRILQRCERSRGVRKQEDPEGGELRQAEPVQLVPACKKQHSSLVLS